MNRYFYVPITSHLVVHDGISIANHLKMIDSELFHRGNVENYTYVNSIGHDFITETMEMYQDRLLPDHIVVVLRDKHFYEFASREVVFVPSFEDILPYEMTNVEVSDFFSSKQEYQASVLNFFESYKKVKSESKALGKEAKQKRLGQKIVELIKRKTDK